MNRLNKAQIEYARKRINKIFENKKSELKKSLTSGEELSEERRALLLKQNKVKLKKGVTKVRMYSDIRDVFDFSPFEQKLSKAYDKKIKKLNEESQRIMDKLMLGDTQQALDIIADLEV